MHGDDGRRHHSEGADSQTASDQIAPAADALRDGLRAFAESWRQQLNAGLGGLAKQAQARTAAAVEGLNRLVIPRLSEALQHLDEGITTLVENGWYPLPTMNAHEIRKLALLFDEHPAEASNQMLDLVTSQVDQIETTVVSGFPARAAILRDAFEAHRTSKFNLSIPVFLAQADGFWHDRCKRSLFDREHTATIEIALEGHVAGGITSKVLNPLTQDNWPLKLSRKDRPRDSSELNRHKVLHGEAIDYGTEINSLKAISFLQLCEFVLGDRQARNDTSADSLD